MKTLTIACLTALMLASSTAGAQESGGHHTGDLVVAIRLPFCMEFSNAEAVATYARQHGSGLDEFIRQSQCRMGSGYIILGEQLDTFPDSTTAGGFRYIVRFFLSGFPKMPLYGLFNEPVTIPVILSPDI